MAVVDHMKSFLSAATELILVSQIGVKGSSPREEGVFMLVSENSTSGTIGGGKLEHLAISKARSMLDDDQLSDQVDIPLGEAIGQCCGGRVRLAFKRMSQGDRLKCLNSLDDYVSTLPTVHIFGAGHVGRALANQFQNLPVQCVLYDSREDELLKCTSSVSTALSVLPEADVRSALPNSAFIILTHDHGLDFLLAEEALWRGDAAYVGMIGSRTKRRSFEKWRSKNSFCSNNKTELTCPIGGKNVGDKRPEIIAAFVVSEVMLALIQGGNMATPSGPFDSQDQSFSEPTTNPRNKNATGNRRECQTTS